ncbi:MAG: hypothetical protein GTN76_09325, partial [Candidatus Aenigmarchaeota archaeon]|nr:hypothetical protein [Candidatus Aenigmarchaeota archaeon]
MKKKTLEVGYESRFWGGCTQVLELGAGQGVVALALSRLTPDSCKIVTVDYGVPIDPYIKGILGARLEEHTGELIV